MYRECYSELLNSFEQIFLLLKDFNKELPQIITESRANQSGMLLQSAMDAQRIVINAGNKLEAAHEENTAVIIEKLEQYCEWLYQVSNYDGEIESLKLRDWINQMNVSIDEISQLLKSNITVTDDQLAFVAIVKNEAPYIREWINFHKSVGVSKFFIYDNESTDNIKEVLQPYIEEQMVIYHYFPGREKQYAAYTDAVNHYDYQVKYMGFIDLDEFVFPQNRQATLGNEVDAILRKNTHAAGVGINWRIYGSSGIKKRVEGNVIDTFLHRAPNDFEANLHIKTICNPRKVAGFINPHFPCYLLAEDQVKYYNVNENGRKIDGPYNIENTCNRLRINHYFTKSEEEYMLKMKRGCADCKGLRDMTDFKKHDRNEVFDDILRK